MKIKLIEMYKHRAETTFRPYIMASSIFRDVGITFVAEGQADMNWVSQASLVNKKQTFQDCIDRGKRILSTYHKDMDVVVFDGSDSASLVGMWEIVKDSHALALMKNSMYKDRSMYNVPSVFGRAYWGVSGENKWYDYAQNDLDFERIKLSGTNWLSTITPKWFDYTEINKEYDVCALFSYPAKENTEFMEGVNGYYDRHRKNCIDVLNNLPKNIKVKMLDAGKHLPIEQYYDIMRKSRIVIAPFGYGEIAPRDLEAVMFGSVLIKPDMSHIETVPNVYSDETYVSCAWDFSDLEEKIDVILSDFKSKQEYFTNNMRAAYTEAYNPYKLVEHTHHWISNLPGYGTV